MGAKSYKFFCVCLGPLFHCLQALTWQLKVNQSHSLVQVDALVI